MGMKLFRILCQNPVVQLQKKVNFIAAHNAMFKAFGVRPELLE